MNPFPKNLESLIQKYDRVLIPELNLGQLSFIIRSRFLVDAISLNKIQGKPFKVREVTAKINEVLSN